MGTGWQLLQGLAALIFSVALAYWLFVSPSGVARRQRRDSVRKRQEPRDR
jgi:hypothetical protein